MSGEGPEAVPTSADPKSRRPTKKRALTPSSAQSASLDALFARPDQEIRLPPSSTSGGDGAGNSNKRKSHLPPEIVTNVQGSSAGAGSGEFHVYKASRRREYERLRNMDEEVKKEKSQEEFEKERLQRETRDEEKTRKNREKREKMKARKANKGKGNTNTPTSGKAAGLDTVSGQAVAREDGASRKDGTSDDAQTTGHQPLGLVIHDDD